MVCLRLQLTWPCWQTISNKLSPFRKTSSPHLRKVSCFIVCVLCMCMFICLFVCLRLQLTWLCWPTIFNKSSPSRKTSSPHLRKVSCLIVCVLCMCMFICLFVCLFVYLFVCLYVCLFVWLFEASADVASSTNHRLPGRLPRHT